MLYLAARAHIDAVVCTHAAHIAALREFWTYWLPTETPLLPQNVEPRSPEGGQSGAPDRKTAKQFEDGGRGEQNAANETARSSVAGRGRGRGRGRRRGRGRGRGHGRGRGRGRGRPSKARPSFGAWEPTNAVGRSQFLQAFRWELSAMLKMASVPRGRCFHRHPICERPLRATLRFCLSGPWHVHGRTVNP